MMISAMLLAVAFTAVEAQEHTLKPKMLADIVPPGRRLASPEVATESSVSAIFMESCSPSNPVQFPISAGEGKGMIGLMNTASPSVSITDVEVSLDLSVGSLEIDYIHKESNVFSAM